MFTGKFLGHPVYNRQPPKSSASVGFNVYWFNFQAEKLILEFLMTQFISIKCADEAQMITVLPLSFRLLSLSGIDRKRTLQCFLNQFFTSKSLEVVVLPKNTSHSNVPLLLLLLLRIWRSNASKIHHSLRRLQHKSCENNELTDNSGQ